MVVAVVVVMVQIVVDHISDHISDRIADYNVPTTILDDACDVVHTQMLEVHIWEEPQLFDQEEVELMVTPIDGTES